MTNSSDTSTKALHICPSRLARAQARIKKREAELAAKKEQPFPDLSDRKFPRKAIMLLEVGQSFFLPLTGRERTLMCMRLVNTSKRLLRDVTCKKVVENGIEGVRVWRIF